MKNHFHINRKSIITVVVISIAITIIGSGLIEQDDNTKDYHAGKAEIRHNDQQVEQAQNESGGTSMPLLGKWKTYTKKDGLPSNKINCVKIDQNRILAGTDQGLAVLEDNQWKVYTTKAGLAHRNVLSIDVNERTGDVWIATMSGLNRWSGGHFEKFDQFNSGLANDVIYQVVCDGKFIWVATAAGASSYNTHTRQWKIFNEQNAPMHEPWTYGICKGGKKVYIAAWGGGVIEYNTATDHFRDYRDPDGEMEIDLFPDDGLVHDITTGVTYDNDILWVASYFGMNKYDGTRWWGYFDHDSGLASNFINFIKANNSTVYVCTDNGLNTFDGTTWVTYRTDENKTNGTAKIDQGTFSKTLTTSTSIAHNYIWSIDVKGDEIWVATSNGLSKAKAIGKIDDHTPNM